MQGISAQTSEQQLAGSWMGSLDAGGIRLRLVFHLTLKDTGQLSATMDSPDQGATGIALGEVHLDGDSLKIDAPAIMGYYQGAISSDSTMAGEWHQAGRVFTLDLKKEAHPFVLNRPQEPKPPYPYREEAIEFENGAQHFSLAGSLTLPQGEGPFPAVVLVSGSGSQNRDEELFGHKPFKVIADQLSRNGIAVLRYDDRGVGASGGNAVGATSEDNASDARAAFKYLSGRREIDPSGVGIIGHSEGGLIAMMLAAGDPDVAFIITLAGPGVDGKTILLDQSEYIGRLSGIAESVVEDNRMVMEHVYQLMSENEGYADWAGKVSAFISEFYGDKVGQGYSKEDVDQIRKNLLSSIPQASYPWLRFFVMFDPSNLWSKIHCPVMALNGDKDAQVMAEKNITAIREGLTASGNTRVTAKVLPGLNHLFQHCNTGLPMEYGEIEETFDPATLALITDWIKQVWH
jgi:pimeloyl-ACP methyl ester carboxylesterase